MAVFSPLALASPPSLPLPALAFVALSRFGLDEAAHSEAVAQTTARTD